MNLIRQLPKIILLFAFLAPSSGCGILWACARPEVTAISLCPADGEKFGKEVGIPFYLPKPLLIISKNFRNIETPTVGLTDSVPIPASYDDQAKYADLNARTNFAGLNTPLPATAGATQGGAVAPDGTVVAGNATKSAPALHSTGAPISPRRVPHDGLAPDTFFTYQIVLVPDMAQKYGLKVRGGPGEMRAAMNLVNGWQFTGLGPFYLKDSSTAQNILAGGIATRLGGQAAADVLNASADLAKVLGARQGGPVNSDEPQVQYLADVLSGLPLGNCPMTLVNYAEINVYEPHLTPDGRMEWCPIAQHQFNRDFLALKTTQAVPAPKPTPAPLPKLPPASGAPQGGLILPTDDGVARAAVAAVFGIPSNSPALVAYPGGLQGGAVPFGAAQAGPVSALPAGGVNQIQVDCGGEKCHPTKEFNLLKFADCYKGELPRPRIQNRFLGQTSLLVPESLLPAATSVDPNKSPTPGGAAQGSPIPAPSGTPPIINQPIFNSPGVYPPPAPPASGATPPR